jgi:protein phosphatase
MGGQAAGEVASKIAVDAVLQYFREGRHADETAGVDMSHRAVALGGAVKLANQRIRAAAQQEFGRTGMGSTIVGVLVEGSEYSIAHVGDSRVYVIREGSIQQLTSDHSLVMEQVRRGLITIQEAQRSEMQNIITRALGSDESVEPDLADYAAEPGETLVLTTDGLTRHVSDEELLRIVSAAPCLRDACDGLIEAARSTGGTDNITCLLLRFVEKGLLQRLFGSGPGEGSPKQQNPV